MNLRKNIVNQCIWGNKFITFRQGNKKCVLFLRNWIRSGVNRITDLEFTDGKLDENDIYQKVGLSGNILREVLLLLLYRLLLLECELLALR